MFGSVLSYVGVYMYSTVTCVWVCVSLLEATHMCGCVITCRSVQSHVCVWVCVSLLEATHISITATDINTAASGSTSTGDITTLYNIFHFFWLRKIINIHLFIAWLFICTYVTSFFLWWNTCFSFFYKISWNFLPNNTYTSM